MYLEIKDYTWSETMTQVSIIVPTKGTEPSKVDITVTHNYLKVNCKPFMFEKFLKHDICEERSKAVKAPGIVNFFLEKVEPGLWTDLEKPDLDKEAKKQWREAAATHLSQRIQELDKKKEELQREHSKYTLKEMMKVEEEERQQLESVKNAERTRVAEEMEQWRQVQQEEDARRRAMVTEARNQARNVLRQSDVDANGNGDSKSHEIFMPTSGENIPAVVKIRAPVRDSSKISISFTERVFPTPERESVKAKEEEWLQQQRERCQAKMNFINDAAEADGGLEKQNDPIWLRDKGNAFFQAGDFDSAIAAYSRAVEGGCQLHSLFSNRAACYLKTRNFFKAIEDASKALELLNPPVTQNLQARVRAHVRRGMAYCQLEMYQEGLMDYEKALSLDSSNESIQQDVNNLREHCNRMDH